MPVYGQGYRALERPPQGGRLWPIAREALLPRLRWRLLQAMVFGMAGWALVQLALRALVNSPRFRGVGLRREPLEQLLLRFVGGGEGALGGAWLAVALVGVLLGGLIAGDRRLGGVELHAARPPGRLGYALGKWLAAALLLASVALAPLLLLIAGLALLEPQAFTLQAAWPALASAAALALIGALVLVACSALTDDPWAGSMLWLVYLVGGELAAQQLSQDGGVQALAMGCSLLRLVEGLGLALQAAAASPPALELVLGGLGAHAAFAAAAAAWRLGR